MEKTQSRNNEFVVSNEDKDSYANKTLIRWP